MRRRAILVVVGLLLFGFAVTGIGSSIAQNSLDQRTRADADELAQQLAVEAELALSNALGTAESVASLNDVVWLTDTEFRALWASFANTLPGDSTAILVVAVSPGDLDAFVSAERETSPDFEVLSLNGNPPPAGHFIAMRAATDDVLTGIDLSSLPGTASFLSTVALDERLVLEADLRRPGRSAFGQMQVIKHHQVIGPSGQIHDAWTTTQIDTEALFLDVSQNVDTSQGVAFSTSINPNGAAFGIERETAMISSQGTGEFDGFELSVDVWSDGSTTRGTDPGTVRWIGAAATGLWMLVGLLGLAISALLRRVGESDRDARQDQLTGLHNRRWLVERLAELDGRPISLLFCDIDRFKIVNDSADHMVGDELLLRVARRMEDALSPQADVVRFGGDEFIVVAEVPEDTSPFDHGVALAQAIQTTMAPPFSIAGENVHVTFSTGIAGAHAAEGLSGSELIRRADVAAGFCKQNGRNRYAVYDRKLSDAELDGLALESDLQAALDSSDLVLHFQPIVDAAGSIISFESLVRWNRNGTLVPPGRFLSVVSEIGRMADLGEIVLRGALKQLASWIAAGRHCDNLSVHVNVDPSQLRAPDFAELIDELLQANDLAPSRLVLELTEGEWIDGVSGSRVVLDRLAALGVGLAIDDFGAGYSSMARILELTNLVEIKIDRSIVSRAIEPRQEAFLLGLREIAERIDVALVAEGVETQEEHNALSSMGIGYFQGYFFGRPAAATHWTEAARDHERSPLEGFVAPDTVPSALAAAAGHDTID